MTIKEEQALAAKAKADAEAAAKAKEDAAAREAAQNANATSVKPATASAELSKQDVQEVPEDVSTEDQFYVHLANGEVMRCEGEDLPTGGGTNAPNGHWVKGGKAFQVVGVYPVESEVK